MIEFAELSDCKFNYNEAWLYCLTLVHNRHKDWRMPTSDEYIFGDKIWGWHDDDSRQTDIVVRHAVTPVRDL